MNHNDTRFCAFLRGVNVKGTNMKMAEVCTVFENACMKNVSYVLASGNVLFTSDLPKNALKKQLEKAMSDYFNYEAHLFVKDKNEVETTLYSNPFTSDTNFHIYGFIGIEAIEKTLMNEFEKAQKTTGEDAKIVADNFYWKVPKGNTLDASFGKVLGRKNLKDCFTSRNINTIEKVFYKL